MRTGHNEAWTIVECQRCHRRGRQGFVLRAGPDGEDTWQCRSRRACEERQTRRIGEALIVGSVDASAAAQAWLRAQELVEQARSIRARVAVTRRERNP